MVTVATKQGVAPAAISAMLGGDQQNLSPGDVDLRHLVSSS